MRRWLLIIFIMLWLLPVFILGFSGQIKMNGNWRTADRTSAGLAPDPKTHPEAIIQVYSARAFSWRGLFSMHTWIAVKPQGAAQFKVYQVVGWRMFMGLPVVVDSNDIPARLWFDNKPSIILDLRGAKAAALIPQIMAAAAAYPYQKIYRMWPGPNSNTFPAYIARKVPGLGLALPSNAMGKDFLPNGAIWAKAPSGTGYQLSLYGVFGVMLARIEGFELNILGLVVGLNPHAGTIELPGVGAIRVF